MQFSYQSQAFSQPHNLCSYLDQNMLSSKQQFPPGLETETIVLSQMQRPKHFSGFPSWIFFNAKAEENVDRYTTMNEEKKYFSKVIFLLKSNILFSPLFAAEVSATEISPPQLERGEQ